MHIDGPTCGTIHRRGRAPTPVFDVFKTEPYPFTIDGVYTYIPYKVYLTPFAYLLRDAKESFNQNFTHRQKYILWHQFTHGTN